MKILPKILVIFFGCLLLSGTILFFCFPTYSSLLAYHIRANAANLKLKTTTINGYEMHYYEGNRKDNKDTLVLLSGFADSKTSFLKMAKYLASDYYIIIPDLLGHGENSKSEGVEYDIQSQAKYVLGLADMLNLQNFHLAGVSGGGLIALYISMYSHNRIKSITLVNTPYLTMGNPEFLNIFSHSVKDKRDLDSILQKVFFKVPKLSAPVNTLLIRDIDTNLKFVNEHIIPKIKTQNNLDFEEQLTQLNSPVLVLHSTMDQLVSIENAELYCKILQNSTYGTLKNTAHYPQYENPSGVAASIAGQITKSQSKTK